MWGEPSREAVAEIDLGAERYFARAESAVRSISSHSSYYQVLSATAQVQAYLDLARFLKQSAAEMRRALQEV
jgi:hypothetical protein